jgi:hypothetical protein
MAKRGRPTIGAEPMTPAERQRRRRAKLVRTGSGRIGFFGDRIQVRYALARCELMIRQGKSERQALVIAVAASWSPPPDFIGPLFPRLGLDLKGNPVLYAPPGPRVSVRRQIEALRQKRARARRDPAAREWLRIVANCLEMVDREPDEGVRRELIHTVIRLSPGLEDHLKRHAT